MAERAIPPVPESAFGPAAPKHPTRHLNQIDLARRWRISERTLERWRWLKQGPDYLKVGGRIVYRLTDVESFEAEHLRHLAGAQRAPARKDKG